MISKTALCSSCALASAMAAAQDAGPMTIPGSLFSQDSCRSLIASRTAASKGDILVIVVSEAANGSTTATTSSSKADSTTVNASTLPLVSALMGQFGQGVPSKLVNGLLGGGSTGATSATAGSGTSTTATSFTTTITVVVKEVLRNGNLVLEGRRSIKMNKQTVSIVLEGTVRPDDILPNDTVLSQNVAGLRLEQEGKGLIADRQREGLLTRILSWVF